MKISLRKTAAIGCVVALGLFSGCEKDYMIGVNEIEATDVAQKLTINETISRVRPALAIRGANCILCHANVKSNLVTDFGFSTNDHDNFYFGLDSSNLGSMYGNRDDNWKTSSFAAQVLVPRGTPATPFGQASAADFVSDVANSAEGNDQRPEVNEVKSVYIGAPTEDDIDRLSPAPLFSIEGIVDAPQINTGYLLYSGNINCNGSIVVKETLFLNEIRISTGGHGCRIYAKKTVFIQGEIQFMDTVSNPDTNLQITSARAILIGLGLCDKPSACHNATTGNSIVGRLGRPANQWFRRETGRDSGKVLAIRNSIIEESRKLNLIDGAIRPAGREVSFERLFLNAPEVHSRYTGAVKGSIVAEMAMFSLSKFYFEFDPVFSRVPILPKLDPDSILRVIE